MPTNSESRPYVELPTAATEMNTGVCGCCDGSGDGDGDCGGDGACEGYTPETPKK